jgi:hypothetical protein
VSDLGSASAEWLGEHIYLFAVLWMLVFGLVPALVSRVTVSRNPVPIELPSRRPLPYPLVFGIVIGLAFSAWAALAMAWNEFTFPDAQIFFSGVRDGVQHYPPPMWPTVGRFFPLGHQEFELLGLIDTSGVLYYLFAALQLAIVCVAAVVLVRPSWPLALLLVLALVTAPPVSTAFTDLTVPERNILFFLAISLLCLRSYLASAAPAAIFFTMAAMAPVVLLKETAFIIPAIIGFALISAYVVPSLFQESQGDRRRYLVAGLPMLTLAGVFLLYYAAVIQPQRTGSYGTSMAAGIGEIGASLAQQPWSWILVASILVRLWLLFKRERKLEAFWDSLPAAAVVYTAAFFVLHFNQIRFVAPPALLSWLYAVHLLALVAKDRRGAWAARAATAILAACVVLQVRPTWSNYTWRKEMIHAWASAARFIADYAKVEGLGTAARPLYVHLSGLITFHMAGFGAFIAAKYHLNVIVAIPGKPGQQPFHCLAEEPVICDPGRPWQSGDLVFPLTPRAAADLKTRQDLRLLFRPADIGFWPNGQRLPVYVVE